MLNTLENRKKICKAFKTTPHMSFKTTSRTLTPEQKAAFKDWTKELNCPLVLRFGSPSWLDAEEKPIVTGMVSAGIVSGFFSISCCLDPLPLGMSSPILAMRAANALSDVALWCSELAAMLEYASVSVGIPARNNSGFSGTSSYITNHRLNPSLPKKA